MSGFVTVFSAVAAVALAAAAVSAQAQGELKPGDPAPAFTLPGSDGKTHSLAEFKGKKAVVLAWFPKAFTGG
jgi:peroxiredoxin Q/BCP